MPLIKSAIKKMRQDKKKTSRNRIQKEKLHDSVKAIEKLAKTGAADKLPDALKAAYQAIDKAAKKNLIHKKTAARRKSNVAKLVKATVGKK